MLGRALGALLPDAIFLSHEDAELTSIDATRKIFDKYNPSVVLHLAAKVGGVKENAKRNADFLVDNILMSTNVLKTSCERGVQRFLSILSSCSYPFTDDAPTGESRLHEGLPFGGNLGYGYAKRVLDIHCQLAAEQYGLSCLLVTPATMYGPGDNFRLADGHVVGALIHKAILAAKTGEALEVWGDGSAIRQFVFATDVARILAELIDRPETGNMIVAADGGSSIRALAESVASACGFSGTIRYDSSKPSGMKKKVLKSERFGSIFPDYAFTPLDQGLRETVAWFRDYDTMKEKEANHEESSIKNRKS